MSILVQKIVNPLLYGCDFLWRHKEVIAVQKMVAILETYHLWRNK